jgi:hypothetical protein
MRRVSFLTVLLLAGVTLAQGIQLTKVKTSTVFNTARRFGQLVPLTTAATALTAIGLPSPSFYGSAQAAAPTDDGTLMLVKDTSAATTGSGTGIVTAGAGANPTTTFAYLPKFTAVVRTGSSIANIRIVVGLEDAEDQGNSTLAAFNTHRLAMFRFDTGLSDTTWHSLNSDGTTAVAADTGITVAINTTYVLQVDATTAGVLVYRINGNVVGTTTSHVPTGTTGIIYGVAGVTLENVAKSLEIGRLSIEQN